MSDDVLQQPTWPPVFEKFNKIPRLFREVVITEKIDGTNGVVVVPQDPSLPLVFGSRNRWVTPGSKTDNYDFADWGTRNEESLRRLGPGRHHGEWWGAGIARRYGLTERRFSLFNTSIWTEEEITSRGLPDNVHVVPTLFRGKLDTETIIDTIKSLRNHGSYAVPFMNPEGIVVYHMAAGQMFKFTLDGDAVKGPDHQSPEQLEG